MIDKQTGIRQIVEVEKATDLPTGGGESPNSTQQIRNILNGVTNMARAQEDVRTGPTKKFAEWLNANWDELCTMTNWQVAEKLNYKAGNVVSMWRTGKTKVSLDRMFDVADLLHVKVETLLPLYFEQDLGDKPVLWKRLQEILDRLVEPGEFKLVKALRAKNVNSNKLTKEQIEAIVKIATDPSYATDSKQAA